MSMFRLPPSPPPDTGRVAIAALVMASGAQSDEIDQLIDRLSSRSIPHDVAAIIDEVKAELVAIREEHRD
jgi:hypothetical protein